MALDSPYCSKAEADTYLTGDASWAALTDAEKDTALYWGRMFLDSNYTCIVFEEDDAPDEIKYANALLAQDYNDGTLLQAGGQSSGVIKRTYDKAGSVVTEREYQGGMTTTSYQTDVGMVLNGYCSKKGNVVYITRT
ncbi:MAG: hypothetical protein GY696_25160 [Gammaproteobacteria bacterium]|nr:hypothetical protein [Gammaproteobacteria bacterium]